MSNTQRILAIIPARGGSRGLPRKNILPLLGKPLIAWTIDAAREAGDVITKTVVSTEDAEIAAVSRAHGADVVDRPAELAQDQTATPPVLAHVLEELARHGETYDIVVLLQPTSPLRTAAHIREAVTRFLADSCDTLMSVAPMHERYFTVQPDGSLLPAQAMSGRRQDRQPLWIENGALYVARASDVREGHLFGEKLSFLKMPREESVDIDDRSDLLIAEALLRQRHQM